MAHSHCTEPGTGTGSTVHIAAGPGVGAENIMPVCLHALETTLFEPCVNVVIIF